MKIKIDNQGSLWLERVGNLKIQECPYRKHWCGDKCPKFDIEYITQNIENIRQEKTGVLVYICIFLSCGTMTRYECLEKDFIDEREK